MKKILLSFLFALMTITSWAYDAEIDGIYYKLDNSNKTASVTNRSTDYGSYSGSLAIPSSITYNDVEYSVTSIGALAFSKCYSLSSIIIPNSVTSIEWSAFEDCSDLISIIIPNSVTSIEETAFIGCSSLTSITIPESVTSIGKGAFKECSSLASITIPESVTSIGGSAFSGCM